jgi:hypothetical protein
MSESQPVRNWTPKVISEYEVGRAMQAAEFALRLGKPVCEVMVRSADRQDLEDDLNQIIASLGAQGKIFPMIRVWSKEPLRFGYGFYKEPWIVKALEFLEQTELGHFDRSWISGLLFGYTPQAIQEFIDRNADRM